MHPIYILIEWNLIESLIKWKVQWWFSRVVYIFGKPDFQLSTKSLVSCVIGRSYNQLSSFVMSSLLLDTHILCDI